MSDLDQFLTTYAQLRVMTAQRDMLVAQVDEMKETQRLAMQVYDDTQRRACDAEAELAGARQQIKDMEGKLEFAQHANTRLINKLKDIDLLAQDGLGEWCGVLPPYIPENLELYFDIRTQVDEALEVCEVKDEQG